MSRLSPLLFVAGLLIATPVMSNERLSSRNNQPALGGVDRGAQYVKEIQRGIAPPQPEPNMNARLPEDESGVIVTPQVPTGPVSTVPFFWEAPEMWHRPLYFDDVQLERYGQSSHPHWQPVLSGAHFFLQFPILPYKMTVDHPFECKTNLGYYRPGSPTPCVGRRLPLQDDAALVEAAAWVAVIFMFP